MKLKKTIFTGLLAAILFTSCATKGSKETSVEALKGKEGVFAVLETEKGTIVLNLFYKETPMTVSNFVGLAEGSLDAAKGKPFYDGLKFHRVISDFMIQGGDPQGNGTGGPGYKFADEFVEGYVFDKPGKLAMANSGANTNGSQFFITHVPTDWLNYKHTIFGEVLEGQDVVDKVAQGDTIKSLKIVRQGKDAEAFKVTQKSFDELKAAGAKKAATFQEELAKKTIAAVIEGCEKASNGTYYQILKEGSGAVCGKGKNVTVEYKGYLPDGQIFDAFSFLTDIIGHAKKEIVLIDGYIDVITLNILAKKNSGVDVFAYTLPSARISSQDINNFNAQYPTLTIKKTIAFHDRFLIIDGVEGYHIGASLKDAGKKCFGVNKIEGTDVVKDIMKKAQQTGT